jgi:hypothetical protein
VEISFAPPKCSDPAGTCGQYRLNNQNTELACAYNSHTVTGQKLHLLRDLAGRSKRLHKHGLIVRNRRRHWVEIYDWHD